MKSPPILPTVSGQPVGMIAGMKPAARFVGVSARTLFDWIAEGRLKVIRHSKRKLFFRPSDLVRACEEIGAEYAAKHGVE